MVFMMERDADTPRGSWIQNFMDHQGQAALVNCLTPLIYTEGSCPPPTDIDEGLMHCLSRSIGKHRVGLSMPYKDYSLKKKYRLDVPMRSLNL